MRPTANDCKTIAELLAYLGRIDGGPTEMALQRAYELGAASHALPVITIGESTDSGSYIGENVGQ